MLLSLRTRLHIAIASYVSCQTPEMVKFDVHSNLSYFSTHTHHETSLETPLKSYAHAVYQDDMKICIMGQARI